jgi:hypothetical protein
MADESADASDGSERRGAPRVQFVEPCEDLAPQIEAFSREVGGEPG